jgi:uncharacterized membrane protein
VYSLGTLFVSGIYVQIPCIKEIMTMMMIMMIIIIIIIIIIYIHTHTHTHTKHTTNGQCSTVYVAN